MAGIYLRNFRFEKLMNFPSQKKILQQRRCLCSLSETGKEKMLNFRVREMVKEDIPQIIQLRRRNDYYDAVSSYSMCLKINPNPVIIVDDGFGKVIGLASACINNEKISTGGMRVVHENYRNMSLTSRLMYPKVLEINGNRSLLGNGLIGAYEWNSKKLPIFENKFVLLDYEYPERVNPDKLSSYIPVSLEIQEFQESHLKSILEYDQGIVGYSRNIVVPFNCRDPFGKTLAAFREGKCVGYGTIKLNIQGGGKLGPLYADEPPIAEALLKKLLETFALGKGFAATCVSNNADAIRLFEQLGIATRHFNFRCYTKKVAVQDTKNIYGLFDLEVEPF